MRNPPIQFAVVREDPRIEQAIVAKYGARHVLLVASGGCTAFSLRATHPRIDLVLVDPNPAQLELVRRKIEVLARSANDADPADLQQMFGIGHPMPKGLTQRGNFESLFAQLRSFLNEFVASDAEFRAFFDGGARDHESLRTWFASPYWKVAFELFFSNELLETMFTAAATRYAEPGSYPKYFRERFERGLLRDDAATNYFLHHVFLGAYREDPASWPDYLRVLPPVHGIETTNARLEDLEDFFRFDLIDLSNVLDWMDPAEIDRLATRLVTTTRPGTVIVYRQLNNMADHEARFRAAFEFDADFTRPLLAADRSLFYSSLHVGVRRAGMGDRS